MGLKPNGHLLDMKCFLGCLAEVRKGNVHNNSLNKDGIANLITNFEKETSLLFDYKQMRNHWDKSRGKWGLFRRLSMVTGLGWNDDTRTFTMDSERWEDTIKKFPDAKEFKEGPPKHLELMDEIFRGKCVVGGLSFQTRSSVGSSSLMSPTPSGSINITDEADCGASSGNDEAEDIMSPPKKRTRRRPAPATTPASPPSMPAEMSDALTKIVTALQARKTKDQDKCEEEEDDYVYCISFLEETQYTETSEIYAFVASMLLQKKYRLLFKTMKTVAARETWLSWEFKKNNN